MACCSCLSFIDNTSGNKRRRARCRWNTIALSTRRLGPCNSEAATLSLSRALTLSEILAGLHHKLRVGQVSQVAERTQILVIITKSSATLRAALKAALHHLSIVELLYELADAELLQTRCEVLIDHVHWNALYEGFRTASNFLDDDLAARLLAVEAALSSLLLLAGALNLRRWTKALRLASRSLLQGEAHSEFRLLLGLGTADLSASNNGRHVRRDRRLCSVDLAVGVLDLHGTSSALLS